MQAEIAMMLLMMVVVSYIAYQVIYQPYFSPLAKFPRSNKLAAVTRLHERNYV